MLHTSKGGFFELLDRAKQEWERRAPACAPELREQLANDILRSYRIPPSTSARLCIGAISPIMQKSSALLTVAFAEHAWEWYEKYPNHES